MFTGHIEYVEETDDAPFLSIRSAAIFLTNDGDVYVDAYNKNSYPGINMIQPIDHRLKGKVINDILVEIKPIILKILQNYNRIYNDETSNWENVIIDEQKRIQLYQEIQRVIYDYEHYSYDNNYNNNLVTLIHYYDYVDGSEIPPAFKDSIDNGDLLVNYGIKFYESSDRIYEKLTEDIIEDILDNSDSYESASKIIKSVYSDYKKEGYVNEFWNDLIPRLIYLDNYNTYNVSRKNLYYDESLIDL